MRLDRFIQRNSLHGKQACRELITAGRVQVSGEVCRDLHREIDPFTTVSLGGELLQERQARYLMLHKPAGVVSSTEHDEHPTVLDLLPETLRGDLHLAGRLDLKTTGLMLLTNDGAWSRKVTQPEEKIAKVYRVQTKDPVAPHTAEVFSRGIYFATENITTLPAQLETIDSHTSRLTIYEGRYHQVKRMFGHLRNEVVGLHREKVGQLSLGDLKPGQYRELSAAERLHIFNRSEVHSDP